jgi:hypothetical protein
MTMSPGHRVPGPAATQPSKYTCPNDNTPVRLYNDKSKPCPVCGSVFTRTALESHRKRAQKRRKSREPFADTG